MYNDEDAEIHLQPLALAGMTPFMEEGWRWLKVLNVLTFSFSGSIYSIREKDKMLQLIVKHCELWQLSSSHKINLLENFATAGCS